MLEGFLGGGGGAEAAAVLRSLGEAALVGDARAQGTRAGQRGWGESRDGHRDPGEGLLLRPEGAATVAKDRKWDPAGEWETAHPG